MDINHHGSISGNEKVSHVLWAIDPFEDGIVLDPSSVNELGKWAESHKVNIEPVYLFSPTTNVEALAEDEIENQITCFFENQNIAISKPRILSNSTFSLARGIALLMDYAKGADAGLIIVSSHGRAGIPRMFFGSFAETLLNISTNFSKDSDRAFQKFIAVQNQICEEIVIFNDSSFPTELNTYFHLEIGRSLLSEILAKQEHLAQINASRWLKEAGARGIRGIPSVGHGMSGSLSESILTAASEHNAGLIVLTAERGPFESIVFRSQVKSVFRASEFPVWVDGPMM